MTCDEAAFERNYRVRFTVTDDKDRRLEPNKFRFEASDLSIESNAALLYPTPDVPCATRVDCDSAGLNLNSDDAELFECVLVDHSFGDDSGSGFCARQVSLAVNERETVAYLPALPVDDDGRRAVVYLLSNSYHMHSLNPFSEEHELVRGLSPDQDYARRIGLFFAINNITGRGSRFAETVDAEVGVFSDRVTYSARDRTADSEFEFFRVPVINSLRSLPPVFADVDTFLFAQASSSQDANHFVALRDAIGRLNEQPAGVERSVVLLTDGDVADAFPQDTQSSRDVFRSVRDEALAAEVAIHVVHLDHPTLGRVVEVAWTTSPSSRV